MFTSEFLGRAPRHSA